MCALYLGRLDVAQAPKRNLFVARATVGGTQFLVEIPRELGNWLLAVPGAFGMIREVKETEINSQV